MSIRLAQHQGGHIKLEADARDVENLSAIFRITRQIMLLDAGLPPADQRFDYTLLHAQNPGELPALEWQKQGQVGTTDIGEEQFAALSNIVLDLCEQRGCFKNASPAIPAALESISHDLMDIYDRVFPRPAALEM